jgi:hypothetical protein
MCSKSVYVIPAFGKLDRRMEDCEFKASLSYIDTLCIKTPPKVRMVFS